jgi:uncharacterized repeat protein (TIGR04076 family)
MDQKEPELGRYIACAESFEDIFEALAAASKRGITITMWNIPETAYRKMCQDPDGSVNMNDVTIAGIPYEVVDAS